MVFQQHLPPHYLATLAVGYERMVLPDDYGPYKKGNVWAQPNLTQAARAMRYAFDHPEVAGRDAAEGASSLQLKFGFRGTMTGQRMGERLQAVDKILRAALLRQLSSPACYWLRYPDLQKALYTMKEVKQHMRDSQERERRSSSCHGFSLAVEAQANTILNS